MKPTQPARLLEYLRDHPGASSLEVTLGTNIVNVTGRVSDLRAAGYCVLCIRDRKGVARYRVVERPTQLTIGGDEVVLA